MKKLLKAFVVLFSGFIFFGATCGSDSVADMSDEEALEFCVEYVSAMCEKMKECNLPFPYECATYADETCAGSSAEEGGEVPACAYDITESDVNDCVDGYAEASCDEFMSGTFVPEACQAMVDCFGE